MRSSIGSPLCVRVARESDLLPGGRHGWRLSWLVREISKCLKGMVPVAHSETRTVLHEFLSLDGQALGDALERFGS
jgi:hypothetical protein